MYIGDDIVYLTFPTDSLIGHRQRLRLTNSGLISNDLRRLPGIPYICTSIAPRPQYTLHKG